MVLILRTIGLRVKLTLEGVTLVYGSLHHGAFRFSKMSKETEVVCKCHPPTHE